MYALGYFPFDKYEKEKIDISKEKSEISIEKLSFTITAIKIFQIKVRGAKNPDGLFSSVGNDIKYLSTATKIPTKEEISIINESRKEFKIIKQVSGHDELKDGITKEVGNTVSGNIPKEVKAIQKRLIELGFLKSNFRPIPL